VPAVSFETRGVWIHVSQHGFERMRLRVWSVGNERFLLMRLRESEVLDCWPIAMHCACRWRARNLAFVFPCGVSPETMRRFLRARFVAKSNRHFVCGHAEIWTDLLPSDEL
jgi:hypothetical protein